MSEVPLYTDSVDPGDAAKWHLAVVLPFFDQAGGTPIQSHISLSILVYEDNTPEEVYHMVGAGGGGLSTRPQTLERFRLV